MPRILHKTELKSYKQEMAAIALKNGGYGFTTQGGGFVIVDNNGNIVYEKQSEKVELPDESEYVPQLSEITQNDDLNKLSSVQYFYATATVFGISLMIVAFALVSYGKIEAKTASHIFAFCSGLTGFSAWKLTQ